MLLCSAYSLCPTLCDPKEYNTLSSSVHGDSPGKCSGMGSMSLLQGNIPDPGIELRSPSLQVDSLPSKPPRKPKSTAVGSLSLLWGSSQPRNRTGVCCIVGKFYTSWDTREAPLWRLNEVNYLDACLEESFKTMSYFCYYH